MIRYSNIIIQIYGIIISMSLSFAAELPAMELPLHNLLKVNEEIKGRQHSNENILNLLKEYNENAEQLPSLINLKNRSLDPIKHLNEISKASAIFQSNHIFLHLVHKFIEIIVPLHRTYAFTNPVIPGQSDTSETISLYEKKLHGFYSELLRAEQAIQETIAVYIEAFLFPEGMGPIDFDNARQKECTQHLTKLQFSPDTPEYRKQFSQTFEQDYLICALFQQQHINKNIAQLIFKLFSQSNYGISISEEPIGKGKGMIDYIYNQIMEKNARLDQSIGSSQNTSGRSERSRVTLRLQKKIAAQQKFNLLDETAAQNITRTFLDELTQGLTISQAKPSDREPKVRVQELNQRVKQTAAPADQSKKLTKTLNANQPTENAEVVQSDLPSTPIKTNNTTENAEVVQSDLPTITPNKSIDSHNILQDSNLESNTVLSLVSKNTTVVNADVHSLAITDELVNNIMSTDIPTFWFDNWFNIYIKPYGHKNPKTQRENMRNKGVSSLTQSKAINPINTLTLSDIRSIKYYTAVLSKGSKNVDKYDFFAFLNEVKGGIIMDKGNGSEVSYFVPSYNAEQNSYGHVLLFTHLPHGNNPFPHRTLSKHMRPDFERVGLVHIVQY